MGPLGGADPGRQRVALILEERGQQPQEVRHRVHPGGQPGQGERRWIEPVQPCEDFRHTAHGVEAIGLGHVGGALDVRHDERRRRQHGPRVVQVQRLGHGEADAVQGRLHPELHRRHVLFELLPRRGAVLPQDHPPDVTRWGADVHCDHGGRDPARERLGAHQLSAGDERARDCGQRFVVHHRRATLRPSYHRQPDTGRSPHHLRWVTDTASTASGSVPEPAPRAHRLVRGPPVSNYALRLAPTDSNR